MAALLAALLAWLLPYYSRADDPITELMSPIVSYQYPDDLSSMALTNGGLLSPIVSYVYCEWPGDDVLSLITSPQVSYLYPGYDGPPTTITIFAHRQDVQAQAGAPVQLTVGAVGTPPLGYQWLRDGAVIPGATEAVFVIASAAAAHNGADGQAIWATLGGNAGLPSVQQKALGRWTSVSSRRGQPGQFASAGRRGASAPRSPLKSSTSPAISGASPASGMRPTGDASAAGPQIARRAPAEAPRRTGRVGR